MKSLTRIVFLSKGLSENDSTEHGCSWLVQGDLLYVLRVRMSHRTGALWLCMLKQERFPIQICLSPKVFQIWDFLKLCNIYT